MTMGKLGFLMFVLVCVLCLSEAAIYQVGDEQGWKEYVNYTVWTASKTFNVGDTIVFKYDKERENVLLVTLDDFRSCSSNRPIHVYQTGLDKFTLVKSSHLYFIGGFHDHCLHGQKVDIRTLERQAAPPLAATPPSIATPIPSSTPSSLPPRSPSKKGPSPSHSPGQAPGSGASVVHQQGWALTLAVVAFVVALA